MRKLYDELQERLKHLESLKETEINLARTVELQLVIVRVQEILLDELKIK